MAKKRTEKPTTPTQLDHRVELRMSRREKKAFQDAATGQGISLSQWMRLASWKIINQHGGKVTLIDLDK